MPAIINWNISPGNPSPGGIISGNAPLEVTVDFTVKNATLIDTSINWGDGSVLSSIVPPKTHTYATGASALILQVDTILEDDQTFVQTSYTDTFTVTIGGGVATASRLEVTASIPVMPFDGTFEWMTINWGDGTVWDEIDYHPATYQYAEAGTYTIQFTIKTVGNPAVTNSQTITISNFITPGMVGVDSIKLIKLPGNLLANN